MTFVVVAVFLILFLPNFDVTPWCHKQYQNLLKELVFIFFFVPLRD